jgi:Fe-S oxidoreductase
VLTLSDDYCELTAAEAETGGPVAEAWRDRARTVAEHTRDVQSLVMELAEQGAVPFSGRLEKGTAPLRPVRKPAAGAEGDSPRTAGDSPLSGDSPLKLRLAYHAPCHLRAAGRGDVPRLMIEKLLGVKFVVTNSKCCGMGGTYGLKSKNAAVAGAIGRETFDRLRAAGAEAVVTSCGMCRTQLAAGTGLPVYHPMELLAEALDSRPLQR